MKRGAMFGLDARIALAIFGALSVISGAALYSAIQDSKVVSLIAQMQEIAKAEEQYYLDTGVEIPGQSAVANVSVKQIRELVENNENVTGWKGPYTSLEVVSETSLKSSSNSFWLRSGNDSTWGAGIDIPSYTGSCSNCFVWIQVEVDSYALADAIDLKIDGVADRDDGNVRVRNIGVVSSVRPSVFIKQRPYIN